MWKMAEGHVFHGHLGLENLFPNHVTTLRVSKCISTNGGGVLGDSAEKTKLEAKACST